MSLSKTKDCIKPELVKIVYGGGKKLSKPRTQNFRKDEKKLKIEQLETFGHFSKQKEKKEDKN